MTTTQAARSPQPVARRLSCTLLLLVASAASVSIVAAPAYADTQTASNATAIAIPGVQAPATPAHSPGSLYPSPITISGLTGTTTKVTARLNGLGHSFSRDLDILLVGPGGQSVVLMSDAGGNNPFSNQTLTFDDAAVGQIPEAAPVAGTYAPTNTNLGSTNVDAWPAPAPAGPYGTTFGAFNGTNPNGTWNLYISDDAPGDYGNLAGGWTLSVETGVATFPGQLQLSGVEYRGSEGGGVATVTINRVAGDDGAVGVSFATGTGSATAGVDYTPVSTTVAFADGQVSRSVDIPIADDAGVEGVDELVPIALSNPTGGATLGSPTAGQLRIQDNDARSNAFPVTTPASGPTLGPAAPYPTNIVVAGASGVVTDVDVRLIDVSHTHIRDLDVLLVAPNGSTTMLIQDVGPNTPVSDLSLTFSDEAAAGISQTSLTSGTYRPSQFDDEIPEALPPPAPAGPWGTMLSALDGTSPNGTWSLYVHDDAGGDIGDFGGGWALTLETATASAGGPYTTTEGSGVTLSGSTTPAVGGATYLWDVDGDGQYDDATGQNPTVLAATLAAIGLGDGPDSSSVRVRATAGSAVITSGATTLTITNVAPTATFSNNGPVALGSTADVAFTGRTDPSSADTTAGFRYSYDFDDDGDWEVGDGTYAGSSTSASATVPTTVLNAVGTFEVNGRLLDKDGGFTDYTTTVTVTPPPNSAPTADAGPDGEVNAGDTVTLDATGSTDPDDDPITYSWVQTAGPAVTLTGPATASPTFTAPTGPAALRFELTVDDGLLTDTGTVTITVNGIPDADAGVDQLVNLGDTVTLAGTGSTDPDGDTLTYEWVQTGGGTVVTLTGAQTAQPTFTAPEGPDVLAFEVMVTDPGGETDTDTVVVTVNGPPTAAAGSDRDAEQGETVTLDGTGSSDPDGDILLYSWVQTAGPAVTLVGANTATPTFTAPAGPGTVTFQLTVDDQRGRTDTDDVSVGLNRPPTSDAGPDQIVSQGETVTLDGTGSSDPEGDPLAYSWVQAAGPAVTLVGANTATPSFTAPTGPATLAFELTVTDDEGLTAADAVSVRVNGVPIADAGPDQDVDAGDTVRLDATGSSDPDLDPLTYSWVQTAGPVVTLTGATTAQPTFTAPTGPAVLGFELTVGDGRGGTDTDAMSVRVNGTPDADAGPDQDVRPGVGVTLDGRGSADPDADPLTYAWVQTAGSAATLTGATTAQPTFTAPAGSGPLTFELTVDDGRGGTDTDSVTVVVDAEPPSVTLSTTAGDAVNAPFQVTITFSEPVSGLAVDDLLVDNGAASALDGSGTTYTVTVSPAADGDVTVRLPAGSAADAVGNANLAADPLVRRYDATAPVLTVTRAPGQPDPVRSGRVRFVVAADEPVTGLAASGVQVLGTAGADAVEVIRLDPTSFALVVDGMQRTGMVQVRVGAGAVADPAGNPAAEATSPAVRWAFTRPPLLVPTADQRCLGPGAAVFLRLATDDGSTLRVTSSNASLLPTSRITLTRDRQLLRVFLLPRPVESGSARIVVVATNAAGSHRYVVRVLVGTSGRDRLAGGPSADVILGRGGRDVLTGGRGRDLLCGGRGDDRLDGGPGSDTLYGQDGDDVLVRGRGDRLVGGPGRD